MRPPINFEIEGVAYQAKRWDVFKQGDVAAALSPITASAAVQFFFAAQEATGKGMMSIFALPRADMLKMFLPLADEIQKMPQKDRHFVMTACLSATQRKAGDHWTFIWPEGLDQPAFPEFADDLQLVLQVCYHVVIGNLGNFIPGVR